MRTPSRQFLLLLLTSGVDVHSLPVGFDRGLRIFHLHVLVTHQCPSAEVVPVQLKCPPEVSHRLLVLRPERVVISYDAASLWLVLDDAKQACI